MSGKRAVLLNLCCALSSLLFTLPACAGSEVSVATTPFARFAEYNEQSGLTLTYPGLDALYAQVVVEQESKLRKAAAKASGAGEDEASVQAMEANRVNFAALSGVQDRALLTALRQRIEKMPQQVSLNELDRNEQLAFWLNLYQIALIEKLAAHYPSDALEALLFGDHALLDDKFLQVDGTKLSLNDIQHRIVLPNYRDIPEVIYGFYQGYVGSPDISKKAYTGSTVIDALQKNADDFINSDRGTQKDGRKLRVSRFYADNSRMFSGYGHDLREHLARYANRDIAGAIASARQFVATITNWQLTDVRSVTPGEDSISNISPEIESAVLITPGIRALMQENIAQINTDQSIPAATEVSATEVKADGKLQ